MEISAKVNAAFCLVSFLGFVFVLALLLAHGLHYKAETVTHLVLSNSSQVANILSSTLSENFSACVTLTEAINAFVALPRRYESCH